MDRMCRSCRRTYPPHARFCGRCGRPFPPTIQPTPAPKHTSRSFRPAKLLGSLTLFIFASAFVLSFARTGGVLFPTAWHSSRIFLSMPAPKADALFDMLAPDHVRVLVSRQSDGVLVQGDDGELRALLALQSLVTRLDGKAPRYVESQIRRLGSDDSASVRRYDLHGRKTAKRLYRLLAFDDVPVIVHRDGASLIVRASAGDHDVLAAVTRILLGEPLRYWASPDDGRPACIELPNAGAAANIDRSSHARCPR